MLVYLNGQFLPREKATISIDDRGLLFGDSLYEVIRSYDGFLFEKEAHWRRLQNGLATLRIEWPEFARLDDIAHHLLRENNLPETNATVYFQITRGAPGKRQHAFPAPPVSPTIFAAANFLQTNQSRAEHGVALITVPDVRWGRCDLKSTNLLPNVLANQQAHEAGAEEAAFVRDGVVVEGSHSNVFAVLKGIVTTHPIAPILLPGITRQVALHLCARLRLPCSERAFTLGELKRAEEVFLTFTSGEITPVVRVDRMVIGTGKPGALTRRLQEGFQEYVRAARLAS